MKPSRAITLWILDRLGLDPALSGDLLEERERGRSAIWYWRQMLIAILAGIWGATRDHKVLALRAVATGFAVEYSFLFLWRRLTGPFNEDRVPVMTIAVWVVGLSVVVLTQTATGWIVARTHRSYPIPMVFVSLTSVFPWYFGPGFFWAIRMLVDWDSVDPTVHPIVLYWLVIVPLSVVCALLGGTLVRPKQAASAANLGKP